jgi:hypothetical protein
MGHLFGPSMWAMTFLLLIMTAAIFVNFLFRIVPMGLPWRLLITSFFVRLSFTQIPFGAQQVEFDDLALGLMIDEVLYQHAAV